MLDPARHPATRWAILALGIAAQSATCSFIYGLPVLLPSLRSDEHLSLLAATVVLSAPTAGVLLTLIAWGALADRYGERIVMVTGTALSAVLMLAASRTHGAAPLAVTLLVAGAAGASVNAASGRMVMGWFGVCERGLAMGARQTAQPLGVAIAALVLPPLAHAHGLHVALLFPAVFCAVVSVAVLLLVTDPPRVTARQAAEAGSPYRTPTLWRIHLASSCLVVPQFAVATFTVVYLVGVRHWDATSAGRLVFAFQLAGAVGRVCAGVWSDRVGSRLGPMRQLAAASAALMLLLAAGAWTGEWWIVGVFGVAAVVTVADNGLAYTAVAELAGPSWTGRALGVHNTLQNLSAVASPPLLAVAIGAGRYGLGFALVAVFPLLALPMTPSPPNRVDARRI